MKTKLELLDIEKDEALAIARQEQEVSDEQAKILSAKQRFLLEQRLEVEREEIEKAHAIERAHIEKEIALLDTASGRDAAEIRRELAREREERERELNLVAKDEELERRKVQRSLAIEVEQREREIALIGKELERERADIRRFLEREREERDREIALAQKTSELEQAEIERLGITAQREQAEHDVESVREKADAQRKKVVDRIIAEAIAEARKVEEQNKAEVNRLHMVSQAEARKVSARQEADATLIRARATSEARQLEAVGIEHEAGAKGRAEAQVAQRMLEAEATGIEAKADALKKYNDAATFLELARLRIEADRDIQVDQAKAMGNALQGAQIRMYGGGDGTVETIRGLFNSGFGVGEALEGVAQSLPEGLRARFAQNGLRGLFGRPGETGSQLIEAVGHLSRLMEKALPGPDDQDMPFAEALARLEQGAGDDAGVKRAIGVLRDANENGVFDEMPFSSVWAVLKATVKNA